MEREEQEESEMSIPQSQLEILEEVWVREGWCYFLEQEQVCGAGRREVARNGWTHPACFCPQIPSTQKSMNLVSKIIISLLP